MFHYYSFDTNLIAYTAGKFRRNFNFCSWIFKLHKSCQLQMYHFNCAYVRMHRCICYLCNVFIATMEMDHVQYINFSCIVIIVYMCIIIILAGYTYSCTLAAYSYYMVFFQNCPKFYLLQLLILSCIIPLLFF